MIKKLSLALAAAGMMATSLYAVPISGNIAFGSLAPLSLTGGSTFGTATGFDFAAAPNAIVNLGASGDFSSLVFPTFAQFYDFTFDPLGPGASPVVWTVTSGVFSFALDSVSFERDGNSITLTGKGIVSSTNPNLSPSAGDFQFSVQGNTGLTTTFSFSANNQVPVPEGGSTLVLLGGAILGFTGFSGLVRKSFRLA